MIARLWHGKVPVSKSDEYLKYLEKTGAADTGKLDGNSGVLVLRRNLKDYTHFIFISFWENTEVIKKFAGDNIEIARYYPEDREYLLDFPEEVEHFDVSVFKEIKLT